MYYRQRGPVVRLDGLAPARPIMPKVCIEGHIYNKMPLSWAMREASSTWSTDAVPVPGTHTRRVEEARGRDLAITTLARAVIIA